MAARGLELIDLPPAPADVQAEALAGLTDPRGRWLPPKLFYDERGSRLFEAITGLEVYYPTRTEVAILEARAPEIRRLSGPGAAVVEFGSGSSTKTRLVLDRLEAPAAYVPIDISCQHLLSSAQAIADDYPDLAVYPVCADYTGAVALPPVPMAAKLVAFYPGSTIGNMTPEAARGFLRRVARLVGPGGALVLGVDLRKDPAVLVRAYNDPQGITAAFNKNVLLRLNRDAGADFDPDAFRHRALYNEAEGRIEMHLVSTKAQNVHLGGHVIAFAEGDSIHTESSYKYSLDGVAALANSGGFDPVAMWTDRARLFSVSYLEVR